MASEHAHKIDGAVRKLRAVMDAFDMKGTNRATMLNAINTIEALRPRPAPAATDTGLETVAQIDTGRKWRVHFLSHPVRGEELVTRSQAEELLAAERAKMEMLAESLHIQIKRVNELEADNAALTARIKELEAALDSDPSGSDLWRYWSRKACEASQKYVDEVDRAETLEAKLAAAEKALEPFAAHANYQAVDDTGWRDKETVKIVVSFGDLRKARAVLGGKLS